MFHLTSSCTIKLYIKFVSNANFCFHCKATFVLGLSLVTANVGGVSSIFNKSVKTNTKKISRLTAYQKNAYHRS